MTYPKTIITKPIRRAFFFTLVAIFLILAPIMIMYSIGYRYDFSTHNFLETGVISIDVLPEDAAVYINNIKIDKKIPIRLTNRAPGTYSLRIEKPGYKKWEKNIDVKSKQTTYIKDVSLIRDNLPIPTFLKTEKNITDIYPSPDGNFILFATEKTNIITLEMFNTLTKNIENIANFSNNEYQIFWSPFGSQLAIVINRNDTTSLNILSASNPSGSKIYTIKNDEYSNHIQWQKNSAIPIIYTRNGSYIEKITPAEQSKFKKIDPQALWYVDMQEKLWLSENGSITNTSAEGTKKFKIPENEKIEKIIDLNANRLVLQSETNTFVVPSDSADIQNIYGTSTFYNSGTKEWLVWSPWELWSIYEENKTALLNRTSDNITSVFPIDNVGALLILNNHGLTSFNPGYYVTQQLFDGEIKKVLVNQKNKTIYFLGKVGEKEGLFELEY